MSEEKSSNKGKQLKKPKEKKRLINFLLSPKQEEMLNHNIIDLRLAKNRTEYFIIKITEDYQTQGKGYKRETPEEYVTKSDLQELKINIFNKLQQQLQTIQMMTQSIIDREETLEKDQKLAKIEQHLRSFINLVDLNTYEKLEKYLTQKFPEMTSELIDGKIYYEIVYKLLQQGDVMYNNRTRKLVWRVHET